MLRSLAGKVAWVGRTAAMMFGLALVLALIVGVASAAFGANGDNFILGKNNAATAFTQLTGDVNGNTLRLVNNDPGTNDSALSLSVQPGETPMKVDSDARVNNLNADKLDGKDIGAFDIDQPIRAAGPLPIQSGFSTSGGQVLILASGSGYRNAVSPALYGFIGMNVTVDGDATVTARVFTNEVSSHKAFVDQHFYLDDLPAGTHTVKLEAINEPACNTPNEGYDDYCTTTDATDSFLVSVVEMPD